MIQLFLIFIFLPNLQSNSVQIPSSYTVIAYHGSFIYKNPDFKSEKIVKLEFGTEVSIAKNHIKEDSMMIEDSFQLEGHWFEVLDNGIIGYCFSSDFSSKKLITQLPNGKKSLEIQTFLGEKLSKEIKIDSLDYGGHYVEHERIITQYEYGELVESLFDGCFNDYYSFENYDLNEVYYLMMHDNYMILGGIEYPAYHGQKEGKFIFEGAVIREFEISQNGTTISYYESGCD